VREAKGWASPPLTPKPCFGGAFGFIGREVKIPKTKIKGEVLGVVNYDKKAGVSTGLIGEVKLTKRLSLGGEFAYNWKAHKWVNEGIGFFGGEKKSESVNFGAYGGGVLATPSGEVGGYGFVGIGGGGAYGHLTTRGSSCEN